MNIYYADGLEGLSRVEVDSTATIHDVKKKLLKGRKDVRDSDKFIFKGKLLNPTRPLADQGVQSGDTIHPGYMAIN